MWNRSSAAVDHVGVERADVLGFSYGGMIAMRTVDRHPGRLRRLILASTTAYRSGWSAELDADPEYRRRGDLRTPVRFDDLALVGPDAPDGALSRTMATASAPGDVWRPDRIDDWDRVLDNVRFSSDWNAPFLPGDLRPAAPDDPADVLRRWAPGSHRPRRPRHDLPREPGRPTPRRGAEQHAGAYTRRRAHGPL